MSNKRPSFFISRNKDISSRPVTYSNVTTLSGPEHYDTWASTMEAVWRSLRLYELVVEGRKPESGCSLEETEAYESLYHHAIGVYIQVVSPNVLRQIVDLKDPYIMWTYLKTEYKRGSTFALVYQLGKIMDLPSTSPSSLVQAFESEWLTLCKLAGDSTDDYRSELAKCFSRDKAKRDFLLGILSRQHKNIVNNLITRDDMSFAQVKQHIFDVDFSTPNENTAFLTKTQDNVSPVPRISERSKSKPRDCTYCKKHFPFSAKGHSWQYCRKMKAAKRKEKKKGNHLSNEIANMTAINEKTASTPLQFMEGL
ncbi:hypothetical protein K3495_g1958 [Podosphaera aphanis]|nr:hypothetical protein K3495_g1958 [Podosphaera aphanis]